MDSQLDLPQAERAELTQEEILLTTKVVEQFTTENDPNNVASFLREHPRCTSEFCLQVVDRYQIEDKYTSALKIASVIESLLKKE